MATTTAGISATWIDNTIGFGTTIQSGFFSNVFDNTTYYFDQNYNSLYSITIDTFGNAIYTGDSNYNSSIILPNTNFISLASTNAQIAVIFIIILNGRMNIYQNNSINDINAQTQDPSSFIQTTITDALSGSGIAIAIQNAAPFLISPELNFGLNDAIKNWVNGPTIAKSLNEICQNHQVNLQGMQDATKRIADFKKKLVKQQIALGDKIRKIQGTSEKFQTLGTFTNLASAFPHFEKLQNIINNSNTNLSNQLASILPTSGLNPGSAISNIIGNLFGGSKPTIINPIDKIMVDITKLENQTTILTSFPTNGFDSFLSQQNFTNQITNLTNNIISKLPIIPNISPLTPTFNPTMIQKILNDFQQSKLNINVSNIPQQTLTTLQNLMNINGPTINVNGTPIINDDPYHGGSFSNIIQGITNKEKDPNITSPNITNNPDPSIAVSQNIQAAAQQQADAPGIVRPFARGSCINDLAQIPLTPRNISTNGSTGDYSVTPSIPV